MTTAVYFDLDGTLLSYTASFDALFARTVGTVDGVLTADDVTQGMADEYTDAVLGALTSNHETPYEDAFGTVVEGFGLDATAAALADEYVEREVAATHVPEQVTDLVERIAGEHPTGILTNGDGRMQRRKLAAHGFDDIVDEVVVSGDVGVRKPDPEIFETAKRRLPADSHVYVGDTPEEDIRPAAACGFLTVHVGSDLADGGTGATAADARVPDAERLAAVLLALLPAR